MKAIIDLHDGKLLIIVTENEYGNYDISIKVDNIERIKVCNKITIKFEDYIKLAENIYTAEMADKKYGK